MNQTGDFTNRDQLERFFRYTTKNFSLVSNIDAFDQYLLK